MTAVQPGSARWNELVREGIIRDGNRNWFLGDAALEIAPMRDHTGPGNGELKNLRQYADELGIEYNSLMSYRQVAATWPINNRVSNTSWKVHQQLASRKDLIKPEMTVSQAALALGQKNTGRTGPESPVKERAAAVRTYLDDPEVAKEVFKDAGTTVQALNAIRSSPEPVSVESSPVSPGHRENYFNANTVAVATAHWLQGLARQAQEWLGKDRDAEIHSAPEYDVQRQMISQAAQSALRDLVPVLNELARFSERETPFDEGIDRLMKGR